MLAGYPLGVHGVVAAAGSFFVARVFVGHLLVGLQVLFQMISVVGVIITVARVFVGYLLVGLQVLFQMISVVGVIITVLFCTVRRWGAAQPPGDRLRSFIYCQAVGGRPTPRCSASKFIVILLVPVAYWVLCCMALWRHISPT